MVEMLAVILHSMVTSEAEVEFSLKQDICNMAVQHLSLAFEKLFT